MNQAIVYYFDLIKRMKLNGFKFKQVKKRTDIYEVKYYNTLFEISLMEDYVLLTSTKVDTRIYNDESTFFQDIRTAYEFHNQKR